MQHGATERCEPREQGVHRLADCWVFLTFVDEYLIETKRKMATDLLLSIGSGGSVPMRLLSHDGVSVPTCMLPLLATAVGLDFSKDVTSFLWRTAIIKTMVPIYRWQRGIMGGSCSRE